MSFMSARVFVDTNILVYAHDASAGPKHERARALVEALWQSRSGVISTQVLQELCVNLQKRAARPLTFEATRALIADYLAWHVVANDGNSIVEALDIEARYRLSFWDALIIQAAQAAGADILYSEDLSDGQRYGDLRVVNPLTSGPPAVPSSGRSR
jgi:predicted nucleic acid-binding protein